LAIVTSGCVDGDNANQDGLEIENRIQKLGIQLSEFNSSDKVKPGELVMQLVFTSDADLDIYVTDPQLETVYFANGRAKSGGQISEDIKCDADELRIEEVRFESPLPGRYRVGVDFPKSCNGDNNEAVYIIITTFGERREEANGSVRLQQFKVVAAEFDVEPVGTE